jgi:hypothetical protein
MFAFFVFNLHVLRWAAYVTQTDVLFPTSTVREAITFSAKCRLSEQVSEEEKMAFVDSIYYLVVFSTKRIFFLLFLFLLLLLLLSSPLSLIKLGIIDDLRLAPIANHAIGAIGSGLTLEQRKRVNIGLYFCFLLFVFCFFKQRLIYGNSRGTCCKPSIAVFG